MEYYLARECGSKDYFNQGMINEAAILSTI